MGHPEGSPLRGPATSLLLDKVGGRLGLRVAAWAKGLAGQASLGWRTPPWGCSHPLVPPRKLGGRVPPHPTIYRGA